MVMLLSFGSNIAFAENSTVENSTVENIIAESISESISESMYS